MPNDPRATRRTPKPEAASRETAPAAPVAVVCDFDGTATVLDVGDVLAAHLSRELSAHVQVVANEAIFSPEGLRVRLPTEEAARELGCTECGSCKRVAVAQARQSGARHVIGIGDGFADRCLARCADTLW